MDERREQRDAEVDADGRALASVLRLRILRLCLDEALTNKEIADRLARTRRPRTTTCAAWPNAGSSRGSPSGPGPAALARCPTWRPASSWRTPIPPGGQDRLLIEAFLEEVAEADPRTVRSARLGLRLSPRRTSAEPLGPDQRAARGVRPAPGGPGRPALVDLLRRARGRPAQGAGLVSPGSLELTEPLGPALVELGVGLHEAHVSAQGSSTRP